MGLKLRDPMCLWAEGREDDQKSKVRKDEEKVE